jgi:hypothetical protein
MPKLKIGIYGSATASKKEIENARQLGLALRPFDIIVITGACSGIPYEVAKYSEKEVWGFSPVRNIHEQKAFTPHDDLSIYKKLIFIPNSFSYRDLDVCKKYRNVISTQPSATVGSSSQGNGERSTNLPI